MDPMMKAVGTGWAMVCFPSLVIDPFRNPMHHSTIFSWLFFPFISPSGQLSHLMNLLRHVWVWQQMIFVGIAVLFSPLVVLEWRMGMRWRKERAARLQTSSVPKVDEKSSHATSSTASEAKADHSRAVSQSEKQSQGKGMTSPAVIEREGIELGTRRLDEVLSLVRVRPFDHDNR